MNCNIENEVKTTELNYFPPDRAINKNFLQWSDAIYVCIQLHIISNHILNNDHTFIYDKELTRQTRLELKYFWRQCHIILKSNIMISNHTQLTSKKIS